MEKHPLVTFVVPIYQVEDYLKDCLISIRRVAEASGCDYEVIAVDDGSKDNSGKIADDIASGWSNMHVIHQTNKGLGAARNTGIKAAHGEYICFVDSDDQLADGAILPFTAEKNDLHISIRGEETVAPDVIIVDIIRENSSGKRSPYRRYKLQDGETFATGRDFLLERNVMPCAVSYIVRRDLFTNEGLLFPEGLYHEDEEYCVKMLLSAGNVIAYCRAFYKYKEREESITITTNLSKQQRRLLDVLEILRHLQHYTANDGNARRVIAKKLAYLTVDLLTLLHRQHQPKDFVRYCKQELTSMGLLPLPKRSELKYMAFKIITGN